MGKIMSAGRKEDLQAAFGGSSKARAVPIWELEFHIWNSFSKKKTFFGEEFVALTRAEQEKAIHSNAEIMLSVAAELNFSAVTTPSGYWEVAPGKPAFYWLPDEFRLRQAEILSSMADGAFMTVFNTGGVLSMPSAERYAEFCYELFDCPEKIDRFAERALRSGLDAAARAVAAGAEAVMSASDIADNSGVFFNPEQMERYILPYMRKWADGVRRLGARSIIHTDGKLYSCLRALAETGIDALQAVDPVAGMEMGKTRELAGDRLCLCGNVDCGLLLTGSPEAVYESVAGLLLDRADDPRFVLGASNAVQKEVPAVNYRAMIQAWRDCGGKVPKAG
jgi:uroporphyrinogen decarboxylase